MPIERKRCVQNSRGSQSSKRRSRNRVSCDCHEHESHDEVMPSTAAVSNVEDNLVSNQIVFVDSSSELQQITEEHVQLIVWRQKKLPNFARILSLVSLDPASLPTFQGLVTPLDAFERLSSFICPPYPLRSKASNALNDDDMKEMIMEISELVKVFANISKSNFVHVKLEVITDDGCAFWHQDCVEVRMVRTYCGPCTEWVPPENSKETLLNYKHDSIHSRSLCHGDIALFKGRGETLEDEELLDQPGIVHRSPRLKVKSGIRRLVLILDIPVEGWHY